MSLTVNAKGDIFDNGHHISNLEVEALIKRWQGKIADALVIIELAEAIATSAKRDLNSDGAQQDAPKAEEPAQPAEPEAPAAPAVEVEPQPIFTPPSIPGADVIAPAEQAPAPSTDAAPTILG